MRRILTTEQYDEFENSLKDLAGRARIQARIQRLAEGNPGDHRRLRKGVSELKVNVGPGYRVYYTERDDGALVILLAGGDKSSQDRDIELAYDLVAKL